MQSGVFAFVVINVDGDFLDQAQRAAVGGLETLEVGGENVVGIAGGNALGELAHVVGVDFPADFFGFVLGAADFHGDTIDRMVVGSPDRAGNESVWLTLGRRSGEKPVWRTGRRTEHRSEHRTEHRSEHRQENYDQEEKTEGGQLCESMRPKSRSSHRLRSLPPLLRLLRRSLPRRPSTQADSW